MGFDTQEAGSDVGRAVAGHPVLAGVRTQPALPNAGLQQLPALHERLLSILAPQQSRTVMMHKQPRQLMVAQDRLPKRLPQLAAN